MASINVNTDLASDGRALFTPAHYHLHTPFLMPRHGHGHLSLTALRALAVPRSWETMLLSIYTMLITGGFVALWTLAAMAISYAAAASNARVARDGTFRLACAWRVSEPFQAGVLMGKFCWVRIRAICGGGRRRRLRGRRGAGGLGAAVAAGQQHNEPYSHEGLLHSSSSGGTMEESAPLQNPGKELLVGLLILLLAMGLFFGTIAAGIFLPGRIVIGNVAPVNEYKVFVPNSLTPAIVDKYQAQFSYLASKRLARAVGAVDSSALGKLDDRVRVNKTSPRAGPRGESSYGIEYSFAMNGVDMGLSKLAKLALQVEGECAFEYAWYNGTEVSPRDNVMYDRYRPWGEADSELLRVDLNSTCGSKEMYAVHRLPRDTRVIPVRAAPPALDLEYVLAVYAQGRGSFSPGRDPWYLTGAKLDAAGYGGEPWECGAPNTAGAGVADPRVLYRVQAGRPLLRCRERIFMSYGAEQPRFQLPMAALAQSTRSMRDFDEWLAGVRGALAPSGGEIPDAVGLVLGVNLGRFSPIIFSLAAQTGSALGKSAGDYARSFDAAEASAVQDLRALVTAAYVAARNMFRDAVLEHEDPILQGRDSSDHTNVLVDGGTGQPVAGAGDWVLPSDGVTTLRVEMVVGLPAAIGVLWLVVFLLRVFVMNAHVQGDCPTCGNLDAAGGFVRRASRMSDVVHVPLSDMDEPSSSIMMGKEPPRAVDNGSFSKGGDHGGNWPLSH